MRRFGLCVVWVDCLGLALVTVCSELVSVHSLRRIDCEGVVWVVIVGEGVYVLFRCIGWVSK